MNIKVRPVNIRKTVKEIDGKSEGFVHAVINRELKDSIDCPTVLVYLDNYTISLCEYCYV